MRGKVMKQLKTEKESCGECFRGADKVVREVNNGYQHEKKKNWGR